MKKKRRKRTPLAIAKSNAWTAFSKYIRSKGAVGNLNTCITCERLYAITGRGTIQAGHFIAGRGNAILFDERGCHPQCYGCNVGKKGNMVKYYRWMLKHYGQFVIDDLERLDTTIVIYTVADYKMIEEKYKKLLCSK